MKVAPGRSKHTILAWKISLLTNGTTQRAVPVQDATSLYSDNLASMMSIIRPAARVLLLVQSVTTVAVKSAIPNAEKSVADNQTGLPPMPGATKVTTK